MEVSTHSRDASLMGSFGVNESMGVLGESGILCDYLQYVKGWRLVGLP